MNEAYESTLNALRLQIKNGNSSVHMIDKAVAELLANKERADDSARVVGDLISLLADNAEHDEGMFSIIHAAEHFDDQDYVQGLISVFSELVSLSPRWSSIVLMRVLNSRPTQLILITQLRNAPLPVKQSIRKVCERINERSPQFLSKTVPVIVAAS